jgi:VanZ family protein
MKLYYKVVIWSFVIAYLCFAPSDEFKRVHITIPHFDKVVHFGMFFILGLLISAISHKRNNLFNSKILPVFAVIYGGVIEIIQYNYIQSRSGDWIDWLFDIMGLLIAIKIFIYSPKIIKSIL